MQLFENQRIVILNSKSFKLVYYEESHLLVQTWSGFITSKEFRNAIDLTEKTCIEKRILLMISNTKNLQIVLREDAEYAASKMPTMINAGLRGFAFIIPESTMTRRSLLLFKDSFKTKEDFSMKFFQNETSALEWILINQD